MTSTVGMYHWRTLTRRRILEFVANILHGYTKRYRIAKERACLCCDNLFDFRCKYHRTNSRIQT